jgi:hypothetical protein
VGTVLCLSPALFADVTVSTSVSLTSLEILPASGTLQLITPWPASVFAQASDSLGGDDTELDIVLGAATSVNASTTLASASGTSSALAVTSNGSSGVLIPNIDGSASSVGVGQLAGLFEITGVDSAVNVQISAVLSVNQTLVTEGGGQSATSEAIFDLEMPDLGGTILLFDNPLSIGANGSAAFSSSPTLTQTVTLQPNTPYAFIAGAEAESSGLNAVPEPSFFFLGVAGLLLFAAVGRRAAKATLP